MSGVSPDLTLVPLHRLGSLLTERRTELGLTIEELTARAALPFGPDELRAIEQGQRALTDRQISRLLAAYETLGGAVPDRSKLIVDLDGGSMGAGYHRVGFDPTSQVDDVLGRYLSLLYLLRGLEPGSELALRDDDLATLADALRRNITELEQRLFGLMLPGGTEGWYHRLRHRLAVPAAGILVGLTAVGSLVLVNYPEGERPSGVGRPDADVAAGSAITIGDAELAPATAIVRSAVGTPEYEPGNPRSVGRAAEQLIAYPVRAQLPGWSIVYEGAREGYRGNTNTITRTITVYIGDTDDPVEVAGVLAHEVGHAIDVTYLDDAARTEWLAARGLDVAWWPESGGADFSVGAGDFAEAVAVIIADSPSDATAGDFTPAQLDLVRSLLPDTPTQLAG